MNNSLPTSNGQTARNTQIIPKLMQTEIQSFNRLIGKTLNQ